MKSERLKKLETELKDLEQWLNLGLVPKKDIEKHKQEIEAIKTKIAEEKERLQFLKESGDVEEYIIPKKNPNRTPFSETPTIPDMDINDDDMDDAAISTESDTVTSETSTHTGEREDTFDDMKDTTTDEDDDPFSDKNRWKRGILDPDADNW